MICGNLNLLEASIYLLPVQNLDYLCILSTEKKDRFLMSVNALTHHCSASRVILCKVNKKVKLYYEIQSVCLSLYFAALEKYFCDGIEEHSVTHKIRFEITRWSNKTLNYYLLKARSWKMFEVGLIIRVSPILIYVSVILKEDTEINYLMTNFIERNIPKRVKKVSRACQHLFHGPFKQHIYW